jgi:hypothetical protein
MEKIQIGHEWTCTMYIILDLWRLHYVLCGIVLSTITYMYIMLDAISVQSWFLANIKHSKYIIATWKCLNLLLRQSAHRQESSFTSLNILLVRKHWTSPQRFLFRYGQQIINFLRLYICCKIRFFYKNYTWFVMLSNYCPDRKIKCHR